MAECQKTDDVSEEIQNARFAMRDLLASILVLDALPERSRMLTVDAELPIHTILATIVSEQHPRNPLKSSGGPRRSIGGGGNMDRVDGFTDKMAQGRNATPISGLSGAEGHSLDEPLPPLSCGIVPSGIPSNVLAEVCEFDNFLRGSDENSAPTADDAGEKEPTVKRWTAADDGWGTNQPMQDLEKMPMGMPVTVGELADFLVNACEAAQEVASGCGTGEADRWAHSRSVTSDFANSTLAEVDEDEVGDSGDMLDSTLGQWRARRAQILGSTDGAKETEASGPPPASDPEDHEARLFVEELPQGCIGPVLVHRVPQAPPRPILCTDDPEASLLKAVQLLLAYPELDALPIVSPVRCTVVAHLTLSYCLAYMMSRLRGEELLPLAALSVSAKGGTGGGLQDQRFFDAKSCPVVGADGSASGKAAPNSSGNWAERKVSVPEEPTPSPWVLGRSQPLRELLTFFTRTHHSGVPIVEDGNAGGVLGLISRRDLLQYLDVAMQSAQRRAARAMTSGETIQEETESPFDDDEPVSVDLSGPVEGILNTLRHVRSNEEMLARAAAAPGATPSPSPEESGKQYMGATLVFEEEMPLKLMLIRLLNADNRKLLFVKDLGGGQAPQLLRIISVSDAWLLLIGKESKEPPEGPLVGETGDAVVEPPLEATEVQ
eukprot:TRINITY_DN4784_c0_g1_i1.p1 TRINITY_DN4784_c0_g1~~TRINITY_DN4784_c0_g1_i1.p1  ORF type:complete len:662 (+),score=134.66 TRINITY_DN4784_c0_g1_i1:189-2174(+)